MLILKTNKQKTSENYILVVVSFFEAEWLRMSELHQL